MVNEINWNSCSEEDLLKPEVMLQLYSYGAFPMAKDKFSIIEWHLPQIRCIIPLDGYNIPRSARKFYEKKHFNYLIDNNPFSVITGCANRELTWITPRLIDAYEKLWNMGFLHTVEVYQNDLLVGGLYGIAIKGAFFGESMFSTVSQASKCALIKLIEILRKNKFSILDVQYITEHLQMFGAKEVAFQIYQELLIQAYTSDDEILFID